MNDQPSQVLLAWLTPLLRPCVEFDLNEEDWRDKLTKYLPSVFRDESRHMTIDYSSQLKAKGVTDTEDCHFSVTLNIGESDFYLDWYSEDYLYYGDGFDFSGHKSTSLSKHPLTIDGFNNAVIEFADFCNDLLKQTEWIVKTKTTAEGVVEFYYPKKKTNKE